jgi:hypothetical protein
MGLAEASVQTGIPKGTIVSWAHEHGLQTFGNSSTREATEAAYRAAQPDIEALRFSPLLVGPLARPSQ